MMDWYTANMSPASAILAINLLRQLGIVQSSSTPPATTLRVLETHCGDARAASELLPLASVSSYTACDFSEGMLALAAERLGSNGQTVLAESSKLPFEDASFDCYMSNLGCCCASDLDMKLKEARRVLAPGGQAAMSMRIGEFEGDTSFMLVTSTLKDFGFSPLTGREGLHIGKDLPALRAKLIEAGFSSAKAWRTWISIPVHSTEDYLQWVTTQPPVKKCFEGLSEEKKTEALKALEAAAKKPVDDGAIQAAVAVVVAQVSA